MKIHPLKKYYGSTGIYLQDHKKYFSEKQLQKDVNFLIDVLKLDKKDKILDLACGHGRHAIELARRGFNIDGLDFSNYLLGVARKNAKRKNLQINFYNQDIHKINLKTKYDKIFLFFSEFGSFDSNKVLKNVCRLLKKNSLFLLDCDNARRLVKYLKNHKNSPYQFDPVKMELKKKGGSNRGIKYYNLPEFKKMFSDNKLRVSSVYGGYNKEKLDGNSQRIILVGVKR